LHDACEHGTNGRKQAKELIQSFKSLSIFGTGRKTAYPLKCLWPSSWLPTVRDGDYTAMCLKCCRRWVRTRFSAALGGITIEKRVYKDLGTVLMTRADANSSWTLPRIRHKNAWIFQFVPD